VTEETTGTAGIEEAVDIAPAPAPVKVKKPVPAGESWGTGRRKSAVARVRLRKGEGQIVINGRPLVDFFRITSDRAKVEEGLKLVGARERLDVLVSVSGGGTTGQAGAIAMGVARALRKHDATYEDILRPSGLLTRDSRMKERKKYGRRGARRGFQFSKR